MCTTYTGRPLFPSNFGCPSILDMAVQLGRISRFAGATRCWWSVQHHLYVGHLLLKECVVCPDSTLYDVQKFFHLHDGNEVATSDIPSTWKFADVRAAADRLQDRIYLRYIGRLPTAEEQHWIKATDLLSLAAEMLVVGPPNIARHSGLGDVDTLPKGLLERACERVNIARQYYPGANSSTESDSQLVRWFLDKASVMYDIPEHTNFALALVRA